MGTNFAKLHRDVVVGRSRGRIIWQPRISCWVKDRDFAGGTPAGAAYRSTSSAFAS